MKSPPVKKRSRFARLANCFSVAGRHHLAPCFFLCFPFFARRSHLGGTYATDRAPASPEGVPGGTHKMDFKIYSPLMISRSLSLSSQTV
ncbi:MAG TPA: hypothetical protein PKL77_09470, partial [Candidatus Omnitrophota bacterium]|nr:hypothetical protein [Candidatus Omnitrophota bacterium]